jgi:hypothetical protein
MSWQNNYGVGIGNVGSYLVSGYPYMTGSTVYGSNPLNGQVKVEFHHITKALTIVNTSDAAIRVHFDSVANTDVTTYHHYVTLANKHDTWGFGVKCKHIYISLENSSTTGSFELYGELTSIQINEMYELTGSVINSAE